MLAAKRAAFSIRLPRISERSPSSIGSRQIVGDLDGEYKALALRRALDDGNDASSDL